MLRVSWSCSNCHASGILDSFGLENLCGACPNCLRHHGEVEYICENTIEEFLDILSEMSQAEMSKYYLAINECARSLKDNL